MGKVIILLIVFIGAVISVSAQTANGPQRRVNTGTSENAKTSPPDHSRYVITVSSKPGVVQVGPRMTYLKEGLSREEVLRVMGHPAAVSKRRDQDTVIFCYEFKRADGRFLIAEFIDNALVGSRIETRTSLTPVDAIGK
jgi:outer membrane protein assembly factor BamE (lipoprotein component of BamABCDE complex)